MINKDTYKRFTERRGSLVIDNCGNCPNVNNPQGCTDKNCYEIMKNRLAELEDKIMDGTLVELPCKVGDTVYEVFKYHKPPFIKETTIEKIVITGKGFKLRLSRNSVYETAISSLGKTLFLSKAEAKLKELQEKEK